ncbi:hypothetical protein GUA87_06430 [Sneathiella sp. P13V-1]|uniref:response regulator transcription factor n=1 Tax=Sneathiella sp. P13V-1 TaxID=2697366 RepID=UPI00187B2408|nr:response regulator transcription factor [Sneathiella sp. P13V-1]MBE7636476.1 hypothetical protein [Sneathiella sp. P13V-1]
MRALVADRHDLFRESLTRLFEDIPLPSAKVVEASCLESFFRELSAFTYDLIVLSSNICPKGKPENCDIFRIRNLQPNTPMLLIEETKPTRLSALTPSHSPIDDVLDKSCDMGSFKTVIENLLISKGEEGQHRKSRLPPKATLYFGATSKLTPRQQDVLRLIAFGKSNREIARHLKLSEGTVKVHVTAILRAFGVSNRTQAMLVAQRLMQKSQI